MVCTSLGVLRTLISQLWEEMLSPAQDSEQEAGGLLATGCHLTPTGEGGHRAGSTSRQWKRLREPGHCRCSCITAWRLHLLSTHGPAAAFSSYDGDLSLPLGWPWEAQSSPRVARESWGLRPSTRLFCPWDFPGKNTGVGCHFLLQEIS